MIATMAFAPLAGCLDNGELEEPLVVDPIKISLSADEPSDGSVDGKVITAEVTGGTMPLSFEWSLNGITLQEVGLQLSLNDLEPGTHTVKFVANDSEGISSSSEVIFTSLEVNIPPTITLEIPGFTYAFESVDWSIQVADENGDDLVTLIVFGDGNQSLGSLNGTQTWDQMGTYDVTASVTDAADVTISVTKQVLVTDNLPPSLEVSIESQVEESVIITLEQQINLTIVSSDLESEVISQMVYWGDNTQQLVTDDIVSHTYYSAGTFVITVEVTDLSNQITSWQHSIEVVEELTDTEAYQYFLENVPADDAIENEIDQNGDGTVDEAEDAADEEGYDWQADFDSNEDGEADHDNGNIASWQSKNEGNVQNVAESNSTAGSGRSAGDSNDNLTDIDSHVDANETAHEIPDENLSDEGEVMDDLFSDVESFMEDTEDEEIFKAEYYESLINHTQALWWNETFTLDLNDDGIDETSCIRATALKWQDQNHDSNPEKAVLYRVKYCSADRDGDGVDDLSLFEIEAMNVLDSNDNGVAEVLEVLHLISTTWTNGSTIDTTTFLNAGAAIDQDEDGNEEGAIMGIAYIRQIDLTGDGTFESESIIYALIAIEDIDDDGTPEKALMLISTAIKIDLDGDGNANHQFTGTKIALALDRNVDGAVDDLRAAQFGEESFDNNSDGVVDTTSVYWQGLRIVDRNFDGVPDKVSMAQGFENEVDDDANGVPETHIKIFSASVVKDIDADGNPEHAWFLSHMTGSSDTNGDGNWDWQNETAAGAEAVDFNSDGNIDYFAAVRVYSQKSDEHANGWGSELALIWILQGWDRNSDGQQNEIHAVVMINVQWDNNSDGSWDTSWANGNVWHGLDFNGDGHFEREAYVRYEAAVSDDDADGNLEYTVEDVTVHTRNSTLNGDVTHEFYLHMRNAKGNVSTAGIAQYENTTLVAYETWNTSSRQETYALIFVADSWDSDRDGVSETETTHVYHDNRE